MGFLRGAIAFQDCVSRHIPHTKASQAEESALKFHTTTIAKWLLPMCVSCLGHAAETYHEFLECPRQQDAASPQSCTSQCTSFGATPSSYAVDPSAGVVSETTWKDAKMLTQRNLTGCTITNTKNWRCLSEGEMMGGVVRRDTYAIEGRVFLDVSGSGGEQFYCSIQKNRPH
jgi:hypothetical protein